MICLDSDCLIDFLKGKPEAVRAVQARRDGVVTTEINVFEVLFGIHLNKTSRPEETRTAQQLFEALDVLPFGDGCGERAAELLASLAKRGETIGQNDSLIAATMLRNGCEEILTRNVKHYSRIAEIRVVTY